MNRRNLIKSSVITAGGLLVANLSRSHDPETDTQKMGVAILGLGYFSSYVAPRIQASNHTKIVALISSDTAKAHKWGQLYGVKGSDIYDYSQIAQIAKNEAIDAV